MNIKSLFLGSAAALVAVSGARAADAVVVAEPEPVEYVRICDAFGAGFFYIPGTETCLKVSGYVRAEIRGGDDVYKGIERDTYDWRARAVTRFDARSETELGTLRSYAELRYNFNNGADKETVDLNQATIELGGFRVGAADSQFTSWTGYLGAIISDDVIAEGNTSPTRSATPIPPTMVSRHSLVRNRVKATTWSMTIFRIFLVARSSSRAGVRLPVLSVTTPRLKNGPARFVWT
jgi:hypothetical protein